MKMIQKILITTIVITAGLFILIPISMHAVAAEKVDIRIVGLFDITGPYSGMHAIGVKAFNDFIKWVNETEYVSGINIVADQYDHGADITKCVAAYQLAVSKKPRPVVTCGGYASHTILAIKPLAKRNRIPCLDGSSARNILRPPGWAFSMQASYEGMTGACGDWILANWKPDSKYAWIREHYENRKPRLAIIGWDNAFGRGFDQKESRAYLKSKGVDFVGAEYIPMSPSDTSAQVLRLVKDKKVDFIYFTMYPSSHAMILKDAARLGVRDKFQDIGCFYDNIVQLKKYAGDLAEASMQLTNFKCLPSEWGETLRTLFQKSGFDMTLAMSYASIVGYYDVYCEAIRRAIKKVGINKVDGPAVYWALTHMKDFKLMGSHSGMTFTETKLHGIDTTAMYQIQKGELVFREKDIYVPDLLPDGKDVPN